MQSFVIRALLIGAGVGLTSDRTRAEIEGKKAKARFQSCLPNSREMKMRDQIKATWFLALLLLCALGLSAVVV